MRNVRRLLSIDHFRRWQMPSQAGLSWHSARRNSVQEALVCLCALLHASTYYGLAVAPPRDCKELVHKLSP